MEKDLEQRINGPMSFNTLMDKIEISQSQTLKRMKVGRIGNKLVVAAEWVDEEVQFYIKERKKQRLETSKKQENTPRYPRGFQN